MKKLSVIVFIAFGVYPFFSCKQKTNFSKKDFIITQGQMPSLSTGKGGSVNLVYGIGDSIMYTRSSDEGRSFSTPVVIDVLPGLYSYATRGPQIAPTDSGLIVTACTSKGNIFSYYETNNHWQKGAQINDVANVAPEGLMGLSAQGKNVYAVWLDIRRNKRNKIVGARSEDGGKTWQPNQLIYTSPDSVVCACCKPSVKVQGRNIYVMFRNWLDGNRDLYLSKSSDAGVTFSPAQKLGNGSWRLDGCPMDGGGLAVSDNGKVETVWRRQDTVYADVPGAGEKELGSGRNGAVASVNNQFIYAFSDSSKIKLLKPDGSTQILGNGMLPVLSAVNDHHVICAWENEKQIHAAIVEL
jgi:hypothetical protein